MSLGAGQLDPRRPRDVGELPAIEIIGRSPAPTSAAADRDGPSRLAPGTWTWWLDLAPIVAGGLLIALAFALSRAGSREGDLLYWVGQAVIILPSAFRVLSPATDTRSRLTILVGMAAMQSMLAWAYSPDQFRFPDELQHVRTARDILSTHKLFTANPVLVVSPGFPGLEEVTVALVSLTGLSLFVCGVIVASLTHMILPIALFLAFRELADGEERAAAIATLIYATAPHYGYFETLYIYSTPALTFLAFTLAAAVRAVRRQRGEAWIVVAFVPMLITHHLTTLVGLALLGVIATISFGAVSRRSGIRLGGVTLALLLLTVVWIELASPSTWSYLWAPIHTVLNGLTGPGTPAAKGQAALAAVAPRWESAVAVLTAAALLGISYLGVAIGWWSHARRWVRLILLLGLSYPVILLVRLTASDGPELATRALTYAMLVIAFPVAIMIESVLKLHVRRRTAAVAAVTGAVALLSLGAIVSGLPPSYERLPGHFYVASFESGVDSRVSAVGAWAQRTWPHTNQRTACDASVCSLWTGLSDTTASTTVSPIYYAPSMARLNAAIAAESIDWVQTDRRWSTQVPKTGQYFFTDTHAGQHVHPLPQSVLTQFNHDTRMDRVYDDGDIRVYGTYWVWHR